MEPVLAGSAFGAVYLLAALVGLWFRVPEIGIAAFWPAAGVSFAALYLSPRRLWPALLVGLVAADTAKNVVAGFGPTAALLVTAGNTVEPLLANLVVGGGRERDDPILTTRSMRRLVLGAAAATSVSGLLGATGIRVGTAGSWVEAYTTWVLGDVTAVLAVGSIALAVAASAASPAVAGSGRIRRSTAAVLVTALTAVTVWTFWFAPAAMSQPYLLLVGVGWVGLRTRPVTARAAALWTVVLGAAATADGHGRFALVFSTPLSQWYGFQAWGLVVGLTALGLTVELDRRRRAEAGLAEDNARLRVAREELARSETRFRSVADGAPVGIFRTDATGRHEWGNATLHRIIGLEDRELAERGWQDRVHPDDRGRAAADFGRAVAEGSAARTDMRVRRTDGQVRFVTASISPYRDRSGALGGMVGTLMDRTEEHLAAERRRAEQERFLLAFTHSASAMWVTGLQGDQTGVTVEANDAMCHLLGVRREEMVGRPSLDFVDPDDRAEVEARARRALTEPSTSVSADVRMRRADGSTFWASYLIGVARDGDGRPRCLVGHLRDVDEARSDRNRLTRMATTDPLTGVANRNLLLDRMGEGIERAHRDGSGLAVLFLDLDRFKLINDSLGHRVGDELLRLVAQRLGGVVRADDTLARLGGDEFVVLCPSVAGPAHAEQIAARIRGCFAPPFDVDGHRLHVAVSIGISMLGPEHTEPTALIEAADTALYRAKENGRSRIQMYTDDLRCQAETRLRTEELIRWALEEGRLRLALQPIVEMATGRLWGREALVRIEDEQGELLLPSRWLPTAEASGLIIEVGEWVVHEALRALSVLDDGAVVCVNVSGHQLLDAELVNAVEDLLSVATVGADRLVLEMTESVLIDAQETSRAGLDRLRRRGVRVAIDDFGTGYSSLSYLKSVPVDIVKVDRSFVSGLGRDHGDTAIAGAVVRLARELGLATVAEGIETAAQLEAVRRLGCDYGQGFLIGRPVLLDDLTPAGTPPS